MKVDFNISIPLIDTLRLKTGLEVKKKFWWNALTVYIKKVQTEVFILIYGYLTTNNYSHRQSCTCCLKARLLWNLRWASNSSLTAEKAKIFISKH